MGGEGESEHRFRKHRQAAEKGGRCRRGGEGGLEEGDERGRGGGMSRTLSVVATACQPLIERKPAINIMFLSWGRFYNGEAQVSVPGGNGGGGSGCAISVTCARGGPSRIYFPRVASFERRGGGSDPPERAIKQRSAGRVLASLFAYLPTRKFVMTSFG